MVRVQTYITCLVAVPATVLAAPVNTTSPCATVARYAQNLAKPNATGESNATDNADHPLNG